MSLCVTWWPLVFGIVHPRALKDVIPATGQVLGVLSMLVYSVIQLSASQTLMSI